jgi:integrase/recombinase XerD
MNHIQAFESYLSNNGKANKTIESYTGDVKGYFRYLSDKNITFKGNLNRFSINSYKKYLLDNHYEPTTINKKLNSLQSFNIQLIDSGAMTDMVINLARDRIKIAKGSEHQVQVYLDNYIDALMFHLETKPKSLRDKVMVQLLLYTGVRVS